ncbi:MAG TPA: hypothetical protein VD886_20130 [Herpetosiphonaceae bacterium]|nr:hypothetical protein [Herpetosiphonaceae bacterium]
MGQEGTAAMGIYIEILIRGQMETLWQRTQAPELHQRWDLRFSSITYLPRPDPALPQRFRYATRIGFGLAISGEGETRAALPGARGARTSALRFWSADPKSLISVGSGYWKYTPEAGGVRFVTRYDYQTRFGRPGRWLDRAVFRPLMGWGTAWSFDRLRLWIEEGVDPSVALRRSLLHALVRLGAAAAGLAGGLSGPPALGGALQLAAGAILIAWPSRRAWLAAALLAALGAPPWPGAVGALALAAVGWRSQRTIPSARRCRRNYREEQR